jgi:hypothetical protein
MDPEQLLVEFYNIAPEHARALVQDIAAKQAGRQPMGDVNMSGGVSRDSMYSAIGDAAQSPDKVVLPQQYQEQLPYFADSSHRVHQRQLDQSLNNAMGRMADTTNIAINGGRTPSQAMQQAPSNSRPQQPPSNGPDHGQSFDAAGNARMQQTPQQTIRPPMPAGNVQPGGPDFNDKYVRYRKMLVEQDPNRGEAVFNDKLEQRRALLMQELQAIEAHRNGNGAAVAAGSSGLQASEALRAQVDYLGSPLYGTSPRSAYDDAVQANNQKGY